MGKAVPLIVTLIASVSLSLVSCGQVKLGNTTPNDQAPSGTVIGQGDFISLNGKTVTGTAAVYNSEGSSTSYTLRLNGISAPSETGLVIVITVNGEQLSPFALRSSSGSQNYSVYYEGTPTFKQVTIRSPSANMDYGQALLR